MVKKIAGTTLIVLALSFVQQALAWGVIGHRVVAEIAQRHLTHKTKRGIAELLGNESLAYWANWSDFVKSDTTGVWKSADAWHYVNIAGNLSKEVFMDSLQKLKQPNLYSQINALVADFKNTSLPLQTRKNALVFVLHLVGDLHQPLHVGRAADLGGNRITTYWFDKKTNIHSVWDTELVAFQQYSYKEFADVLDIADRRKVKDLQQSPMEEWFYETYTLANKVYATVAAEEKLGYKYNYIFQETLEQQLLKGGLRLAEVLNEAFK